MSAAVGAASNSASEYSTFAPFVGQAKATRANPLSPCCTPFAARCALAPACPVSRFTGTTTGTTRTATTRRNPFSPTPTASSVCRRPAEIVPFAVIDAMAGNRVMAKTNGGPWDRGNAKFPDMPQLAAQIRSQAGARPGIWIRPLAAAPDAPQAWRLPRDHAYLDPTVPEARALVAADIARLHTWGYELIKHDFSTYDITGKWGNRHGRVDHKRRLDVRGRPEADDRRGDFGPVRRHSAKPPAIRWFWAATPSAIFPPASSRACRIGDDTSGHAWERTRRMGVNSLAFRACQHDTFYAADPDCVGVTQRHSLEPQPPVARPRRSKRHCSFRLALPPTRWARSSSATFRAALALASGGTAARPARSTGSTRTCPARWELAGKPARFDWLGSEGASPVRCWMSP